jgi:hypothetical protein
MLFLSVICSPRQALEISCRLAHKSSYEIVKERQVFSRKGRLSHPAIGYGEGSRA